MATQDNPLGAFLRGFQGAQQRALQQAQQMEENALTKQLREIQLLNAQRQMQEALKTPEQRAQEALTARLITQAVQGGGVRAAEPGLQGLDVAIAQALTPQTQTALEAGTITPQAAVASLPPVEFETPVPGTGGAFVESPVLARESQARDIERIAAEAKARSIAQPARASKKAIGLTPDSRGVVVQDQITGDISVEAIPGAAAEGAGIISLPGTGRGSAGSRSILAEDDKGTLRNILLRPGESLPEGFKPREKAADPAALRKEFNARQEVKSYRELDRQINIMRGAFEQLSTGKSKGPIDQALITTFNKILDPTSVVRESEYARTPEGAALIRRIEGRLQQFTEGGVAFTDAERRDLLQVAEALFARAEDSYQNVRDEYVDIATSIKADPTLVVGREKGAKKSEENLPRGTISTTPTAPIGSTKIGRFTVTPR